MVNKMSHAYNQQTALLVYHASLDFYHDVSALLQVLQALNK